MTTIFVLHIFDTSPIQK